MAKSVVLIEHAGWRASLSLSDRWQPPDDPRDIRNAECTAFIVQSGEGGPTHFEGVFAAPVGIPGALLKRRQGGVDQFQLLSISDLQGDIGESVTARVHALQASWSDVVISENATSFLGRAVGDASLSIAVDLSHLCGVSTEPTLPTGAVAELRLKASGSVKGTRVSRALDLVVPIRAQDPELEFSLPPLGLKLPAIPIPAFTWPQNKNFSELDCSFPHFAGLDLKVVGQLDVTADGGAGTAPLRIFGAQLEVVLRVEGPTATTLATINDLTAEWLSSGEIQISYSSVVLHATQNLRPATWSLGPLDAGCEGLDAVAVLHDADADRGLEIRIRFSRLWLRARSSPADVIAISGSMTLGSSGITGMSIELLEPTRATLTGMVTVLSSQVVRGLCRWGLVLAPDSEIASSLLNTLSRMLAGANEAAGVIGEAIAKLVELLLKQWRPIQAGSSLQIEFRFRTEPLTLAQVAIIGVPVGQAISIPRTGASGIAISIPPGVAPVVLLDLRSGLAVYVGARVPAEGTVRLSSDLWLDKGTQSVEAIRDADGQTGNRNSGRLNDSPAPTEAPRPNGPLLALAIKRKNGSGSGYLLIAGVEDGRAVFLRRLVGPIDEA
ncbi:MAG: hypothetical protein KA763_09375, partial [Xanthomonadales bacterium]|nr:hypothetical protein [Xanthomonadales bacterium]